MACVVSSTAVSLQYVMGLHFTIPFIGTIFTGDYSHVMAWYTIMWFTLVWAAIYREQPDATQFHYHIAVALMSTAGCAVGTAVIGIMRYPVLFIASTFVNIPFVDTNSREPTIRSRRFFNWSALAWWCMVVGVIGGIFAVTGRYSDGCGDITRVDEMTVGVILLAGASLCFVLIIAITLGFSGTTFYSQQFKYGLAATAIVSIHAIATQMGPTNDLYGIPLLIVMVAVQVMFYFYVVNVNSMKGCCMRSTPSGGGGRGWYTECEYNQRQCMHPPTQQCTNACVQASVYGMQDQCVDKYDVQPPYSTRNQDTQQVRVDRFKSSDQVLSFTILVFGILVAVQLAIYIMDVQLNYSPRRMSIVVWGISVAIVIVMVLLSYVCSGGYTQQRM